MDPVTRPVPPATTGDQQWADLAAQLTPAASLARIDTATARATATLIGTLITGLGALTAGNTAHGTPRYLAIAAVITATTAVACALTAQVLTITRGLNPANLAELQAWYHRQFHLRARITQTATMLLILAALLAGATATMITSTR